MYILGINPGHNGTAALLKDGKIIACASEERFSRIKNNLGFPFGAMEYVLDFGGIKISDVNYVIFNIMADNLFESGGVFDLYGIVYAKKSTLNKAFGFLAYKYPNLVEPLIKLNRYRKNHGEKLIKEKSRLDFSERFNIPKERVLFLDHHLAHSFASCFNLPENEKSLIFSLDAEGDGLCATVNIFDGKTKTLRRISKTPKRASLGYLYAIITIYLGMKAGEHEFKVMGLAPYAKKDKVEEAYKIIKDIIWVDGLEFKSSFRTQYSDAFIKDKLMFIRFDSLAGAIQKLTEELTCKWVRNAINLTGIKNVALTGGVFMNVKANEKIAEMPEVKKIYCMPSAGDESGAIGACYYGCLLYSKKNSIPFNPKPIEDLYLGPEYSDEEIEAFLNENKYNKKYNIKSFKNIEKEVAKLLAKGEIVARFSGRSEWGARALGNRSILANPSNKESIVVLNELIKDRDFWMPFTPSILDESAKDYIVNLKKIDAPYMTITFNSTDKAKKELPAAMHPYDSTIRPQVVYKSWNPSYHYLIKEFKKLTGIGGILNTSFNLHGEPNVLSPKDAIHTLEDSGLKHLAIGSFLVSKK